MLNNSFLLKENNKYGNDCDDVIEYKYSIFNKEVCIYKKYTNELTRKKLIKKFGEPDEEYGGPDEGCLIFRFVKSDYIMEV